MAVRRCGCSPAVAPLRTLLCCRLHACGKFHALRPPSLAAAIRQDSRPPTHSPYCWIRRRCATAARREQRPPLPVPRLAATRTCPATRGRPARRGQGQRPGLRCARTRPQPPGKQRWARRALRLHGPRWRCQSRAWRRGTAGQGAHWGHLRLGRYGGASCPTGFRLSLCCQETAGSAQRGPGPKPPAVGGQWVREGARGGDARTRGAAGLHASTIPSFAQAI